LQLARGGVQPSADRRQRDVHDRVVHDREKNAQAQDREDRPPTTVNCLGIDHHLPLCGPGCPWARRFIARLSPAEALAYLERSNNVYRRRLAELENIARTVDWTSDVPNRATRLTLEKGLRNYRMLIEWANWATERINAGALEPGGPVPGEHEQGDSANANDAMNVGHSRTAKQRSSTTGQR
jgi:hypothetical protein